MARGAKAQTLQEMGATTFEPLTDPIPDKALAERYGQHLDFFEGKTILPICSPRGKLLGFDSRSVERKDVSRFLLPEANWTVSWIGMPWGMRRIWEGKPVWVVEGAFDMFALEHAVEDQGAILGSGPAHLNFKHLEFFRRWKPPMVNMCFDMDEAGRRGSKKAVQDLTRFRVSCREIPYGGPGVDPGDLWDRGGAVAVREAFSRFI